MHNYITPDPRPLIYSGDYMEELNFDYIETYSFNRLHPLLEAEREELFERKQHDDLTGPEMQRFEALDKTYNGFELLVDKDGAFHYSSEQKVK